jgi:hypothetical protein
VNLGEAIRRRPAVAVAFALAVLAALAFALRSCGGDEPPPPDGAARAVPASALVYVHLSTDRERDAVRRALDLADRFPGFPRVRSGLLRRLSAAGPGVSFERDVEPWLGDEAALALLTTRGTTAGSLVVLDVRDRRAAQRFLARVGGPPGRTSYRGTAISSYGNAASAFAGRYLLIGPPASLRAGLDAFARRSPALARSAAYRRATRDLPAARVADVYASPEGVTRLLATQGGALGAAGALIDQPALAGTSMSLVPEDEGARLRVHSVLDRRAAARQPRTRPFAPELVESVPEDAMAYFGLTRLDRAATRLIGAGLAGGGAGRRVTDLLRRASRDLGRRGGVDLRRDVLPLFQGEVALWLAPAIPAPVLTLISSTDDEDRTREAFARLQPSLARLLGRPEAGTIPGFEQRDIGDGVQAFQLRLGPGVELDYAVFDGKLVVSTSLDGLRQVKDADHSLAENGSFQATVGDRPDDVTSLVFLDFSELLRLAERTGLSDSRAYLGVREDLRKVRALGAAAYGGRDESTTELFIEIP